MLPVSDPNKRPSPPHRLRGWGSLRLQGSGRIEVRLQGTGSLEVRRLRHTDFTFEGRGVRRFPDANRLVVSAARGRLVLEGTSLDVTLRRGYADVRVAGTFLAWLDGRGEWVEPSGARRGWGLAARTVELRSAASSADQTRAS
jgi:hypothetical protein